MHIMGYIVYRNIYMEKNKISIYNINKMYEICQIYVLMHVTMHVVIDFVTDYLNSNDPYY